MANTRVASGIACLKAHLQLGYVMSNRKQFESLLSQLESVYNQDVLGRLIREILCSFEENLQMMWFFSTDERRRADELESRLNRLKQDKITLKQEVHRFRVMIHAQRN